MTRFKRGINKLKEGGEAHEGSRAEISKLRSVVKASQLSVVFYWSTVTPIIPIVCVAALILEL